MQETGGLGLASAITLVLQANELTTFYKEMSEIITTIVIKKR